MHRKILVLFLASAVLLIGGWGCKKNVAGFKFDSNKTVEDIKENNQTTKQPVKKKVCNIQKNIKQDYCGIIVPAKRCKCAFHGQYCNDINLTKTDANKLVNKGFQQWLAGLKAKCEAEE